MGIWLLVAATATLNWTLGDERLVVRASTQRKTQG